MRDFTAFDGLLVHGVAEFVLHGGDVTVDHVPDEEAEYYTVFGYCSTAVPGQINYTALYDADTRADAEDLATVLSECRDKQFPDGSGKREAGGDATPASSEQEVPRG